MLSIQHGIAVTSLLLLLPACSSQDADVPGTGGASEASGAGGAGGAAPVVIGGDRPVEVYVPSSYKQGSPVPLVMLLHGYSASGGLQDLYFQLKPIAEERGFLYVFPDGLKDAAGNGFWNATDACCDFAKSGVDDSAYLRGIIDDIKKHYSVDEKRVFVLGHSNGGFMSYRMACDHADAIAAIASLAGAMVNDTALCKPSEAVSVLQIHGTEDNTVSYGGGSTGASAYPSAQVTVEDWAKLDGCDPTPQVLAETLDLDSGLPGSETTRTAYSSGCKPGGHAELWTIQGGSHLPALSNQFSPSIIDFLFAHAKP